VIVCYQQQRPAVLDTTASTDGRGIAPRVFFKRLSSEQFMRQASTILGVGVAMTLAVPALGGCQGAVSLGEGEGEGQLTTTVANTAIDRHCLNDIIVGSAAEDTN
jgi:hypothetical protein